MTDPTPDQLKEAADHLARSDDELLKSLSAGRENAFPEDLLKRGRTLYANLKSNHQRKVCSSEDVRALFAEGPANRRLLLVCAIADLIGGHGAVAVAALMVKEGLATYCAAFWPDRAH